MKRKKREPVSSGKLRIGDDWNAITIIALSQTNPLKAVAELVENSIDAHAANITIVRGREGGQQFLRITDDGDGLPRDSGGMPDFKYVATHICDSIKRELKAQGQKGLQGEFGIGLLSFWVLGEELTMVSSAADGKTYQMQMRKADPSYKVRRRQTLFPARGTEIKIKPLLAGIRQISGEKIQWYLASELRDRIRGTHVAIKVVDRLCRSEFVVEPRRFDGRLLHQLPMPQSPDGELYLELYLAKPDPNNCVGLYRNGTRVLESLTRLDAFSGTPWNTGYLQGIIDAPWLHLTPGTRDNIILDEQFIRFRDAMRPVEQKLDEIVADQKKAEEQHANRSILRSVQKALREALLALPEDEYDWFDLRSQGQTRPRPVAGDVAPAGPDDAIESAVEKTKHQREFFEFAGPLYSVIISPSSCQMRVGMSRKFRAIARDRLRRPVETGLAFTWTLADGAGRLNDVYGEFAEFTAGEEPGLARLKVSVAQENCVCDGEALVTITDTLLPDNREPATNKQGLPGYTYEWSPGEPWRSRYSEKENLVIINKGHRDFVFAARFNSLQTRYICRLFVKELVTRNFSGFSTDQLLERMVELSLYTEENLK